MKLAQNYLNSAEFEFRRYKGYGDRTFEQLQEAHFFWTPNEFDNSIAIIIKHLSGNMRSRWINFLSEDGEKPWRNRENEFERPPKSKKALLDLWEGGWSCLFNALDVLQPSNLDKTISIRNQELTLPEAINRQLAHYASHVGQIVYIGKTIKGTEWISPTIPKGGSSEFNETLMGQNS